MIFNTQNNKRIVLLPNFIYNGNGIIHKNIIDFLLEDEGVR